MSEQDNKPGPIDAQPTAKEDASAGYGAQSSRPTPMSDPVPQEARQAVGKRTLLFAGAALGTAELELIPGARTKEQENANHRYASVH